MRRGALLDLILIQMRKNSLGLWMFEAASAAVTVRWLSSGSWEEGAEEKTNHNPGLQESRLTSSGTCLEKFQGKRPWREEGPRNTGWYSKIISFRLMSNPSQKVGSQAEMPAGLYGWMRSSCPNWVTERDYRKLEAGTDNAEEYKAAWACRDTIRKAKVHLDLKSNRKGCCKFGSKRKMWAHCWMGQGLWWRRM